MAIGCEPILLVFASEEHKKSNEFVVYHKLTKKKKDDLPLVFAGGLFAE